MIVDTKKITIPAKMLLSPCEAGYAFLFVIVLLVLLPFLLHRPYHVKAFGDENSIIVDKND
jgi:hypothetical protein